MKQTIRGSWIRRWFLKQDDFTLWAIFIIFQIALWTAALSVITLIAEAVFLR